MTPEEIRAGFGEGEWGEPTWNGKRVCEFHQASGDQLIWMEIAAQLAELNAQIRVVLQHFRINSDDTPPHGQG